MLFNEDTCTELTVSRNPAYHFYLGLFCIKMAYVRYQNIKMPYLHYIVESCCSLMNKADNMTETSSIPSRKKRRRPGDDGESGTETGNETPVISTGDPDPLVPTTPTAPGRATEVAETGMTGKKKKKEEAAKKKGVKERQGQFPCRERLYQYFVHSQADLELLSKRHIVSLRMLGVKDAPSDLNKVSIER